MPEISTALRDAFKNIALCFATCIVSLVALELGLRAINAQPLWPDRNLLLERALVTNKFKMSEYHPVLGWVMRPGLSINPSGPHSFTSGELGIRMNGPKIVTEVPRNAILAVGDSFTAGSEVGDAETWPAFLEQMLGEPVLNAAAGGWATDQIVLRAEELIPKLMPKMIIISYLANDILRAEYKVYGGGPKPYFLIDNGNLVLANVPVPRTIEGATKEIGIARSLLGYSYAVDWTMSRLGAETWFRIVPHVKAPTDPNEVSCLLIHRLKRETDARRIRLIFLLQWSGNEISQWRSRPFHATHILECAHDAGIQTVDSWSPLKQVFARGEQKLKELSVMHQNGTLHGHMSGAGNYFIADLLARAVRDPSFTPATTDGSSAIPAPRIDMPLFDDRAIVQNILVSTGPAPPSNGAPAALLLDDRSREYGLIYQDARIADDDKLHTVSVDLKKGTSARTQVIMKFLGGRELIFHTYLDTDRMSPDGATGKVTRKHLGDGWYRIGLSGANNNSGNSTLRVMIIPRQGRPEDVGSIYLANARLDPQPDRSASSN
jgi:hypothetical protein